MAMRRVLLAFLFACVPTATRVAARVAADASQLAPAWERPRKAPRVRGLARIDPKATKFAAWLARRRQRRLVQCAAEQEVDLSDTSQLRRLLEGCSLIWHLHTPKTGGTSLAKFLEEAKLRSLVPGRDGHGHQHFNFMMHGIWLENRMQFIRAAANRARALGRPAFFSEEIPLPDILAKNFSMASETCFLTVVRDPREWYESAARHMERDTWHRHRVGVNRATGLPAMVEARQGYFELDNPQTWSAGGEGYRRLFLVRLPALSPFMRAVLAALDLTRKRHRSAALERRNVAPDTIRCTSAVCKSLAAPVPVTHEWIQEHLSADLQLWGLLNRTRTGVTVLSASGTMQCDRKRANRQRRAAMRSKFGPTLSV